MRRQMKMVLCSMVVISMTASCQKTPDMEYVTNKEGYSTLIQDNATMDNGISVSQQVQAPTERIVETLEGTNDYTSIKIDAQVTVPEATAIPVYQYGNMDINSELAEQYVTAFFDDGMVRSWDEDCNIYTEEDYLAEIERLTKELEDGQTWDGYVLTENDKDAWEMDIENSRSVIEWGDTAESGYGASVNYTFYAKEFTLENDCLYNLEYLGFTGERNGIKSNLYFENDGVNRSVVFWRTPNIIWNGKRTSLVEASDATAENACRYTTEEAKTLCSEFLSEMGLNDFVCGSIKDLEVYAPNHYTLPYEEVRKGRNGYCLHFYRSYNSNVNYGAVKEQESHIFSLIAAPAMNLCESYASNKAWEDAQNPNTSPEAFELPVMEEVAMFIVTDDGLISGAVINPMVTEKCLAENVKLLSFDRVLEQAKTQLVIQYGDTGTSSGRDSYKIQKIELSYARMQAPDTVGEYILVPVWNFKLGESGTTLISINAIDGTVFNLEDGY